MEPRYFQQVIDSRMLPRMPGVGLAAWRRYSSSEVMPSLEESPGRRTCSHSYREMYFCLHDIVVQGAYEGKTQG